MSCSQATSFDASTGSIDAYVRARATSTTELISINNDGQPASWARQIKVPAAYQLAPMGAILYFLHLPPT